MQGEHADQARMLTLAPPGQLPLLHRQPSPVVWRLSTLRRTRMLIGSSAQRHRAPSARMSMSNPAPRGRDFLPAVKTQPTT